MTRIEPRDISTISIKPETLLVIHSPDDFNTIRDHLHLLDLTWHTGRPFTTTDGDAFEYPMLLTPANGSYVSTTDTQLGSTLFHAEERGYTDMYNITCTKPPILFTKKD